MRADRSRSRPAGHLHCLGASERILSGAAVRALLFDAAGTLITPAAPVGETYAELARTFGVELPAARLEDAFRRVFANAPPLLFPDAATPTLPECERDWWWNVVRGTFLAADGSTARVDLSECFEALWSHYATGRAWKLRAGTRPALRELRGRGLRIGLASNFDHRLPFILQELEIIDLFDSVTIPSTCRTRKPAPGFFAAALRALGVECRETVYVGDDAERDLAAARRAGMRALDIRELSDLSELAGRLPDRAQPLL